ncbi:hypothetical protein HYPDE_34058 [Hyphomicrobium denitrificans 1NES1]|uniref:DUF1489 family protein n=1 Tax=Hyphomicrobium denitrificans 1NES1 TaxID=670307 RepID=N0B4Q6_9HYPH|nr:DUF1489 domain-containing protein [Hyphomicrobium denitrificans]AGK58484.1 hypothetical protein HYPDE_34058 [Hyphomicrobium denitrificans 1NES1]
MTLHLVKLCVGATSIEDLAAWQRENRQCKTRDGKACVYHPTYQFPKRRDELLDGGSLYWVIRGTILVRQKLVSLDDGTREDGTPCCHLVLAPPLIPVRPTPRRAFQGWRYLDGDDAPPDLKIGKRDQVAVMPAEMRKKLADLGLL